MDVYIEIYYIYLYILYIMLYLYVPGFVCVSVATIGLPIISLDIATVKERKGDVS